MTKQNVIKIRYKFCRRCNDIFTTTKKFAKICNKCKKQSNNKFKYSKPEIKYKKQIELIKQLGINNNKK